MKERKDLLELLNSKSAAQKLERLSMISIKFYSEPKRKSKTNYRCLKYKTCRRSPEKIESFHLFFVCQVQIKVKQLFIEVTYMEL